MTAQGGTDPLEGLQERRDALGAEVSARLAAGDPDSALRAQSQLVEVLRAVSGPHRWYRRLLALELLNLALVQERAGRRRAAVHAARESYRMFTVVHLVDDHRFGPEVEQARRELRRLGRVRLFLEPRRR